MTSLEISLLAGLTTGPILMRFFAELLICSWPRGVTLERAPPLERESFLQIAVTRHALRAYFCHTTIINSHTHTSYTTAFP